MSGTSRRLFWILCLIPFAGAIAVWLSPLSFVPVPWPDDSAFYFVARELFKWPPRWVMLPQAPFEPTYRIFNFNTMPLYPILIGLGRLIGIDGSFALKLWPLGAWAASGALLTAVLYRAGLPALATLAIALGCTLDPTLRWASVLIRPESLIGLFGLALVLGLTFGFPKRWVARGDFWDPAAALLALGAYCHFNAVHLIFPAALALLSRPRRLVATGGLTALYLSPWLLTVLVKLKLFIHQMTTQWSRLAVGNDWLSTPTKALSSIFQDMGSPDPYPPILQWAAAGIWLLILLAIGWGLLWPALRLLLERFSGGRADPARAAARPDANAVVGAPVSLAPAAGWVLSSVWLWHTKPEVWFTYYMHLALWAFAGVASLKLWRTCQARGSRLAEAPGLAALFALLLPVLAIFAYVDVRQAIRMGDTRSWKWSVYHDYIGCIDAKLVEYEAALGHPRPFRVWCPTFPDITIELSRRHPDWELTRTNDFWDRAALAVQHGRDVEAVVVAETINAAEREITAPQSEHPEISSTWMTWETHFLNQLWVEPGWKPNRFLCQRGRWQAFMFMR